jgi:hypothetical protein
MQGSIDLRPLSWRCAANFGEKRGAPGSSLGEPIIKRLRIPIVVVVPSER